MNTWNIQRLPDEMLFAIFQRLPPRERLSAAAVCRRWHDIMRSVTLFRGIPLQPISLDPKLYSIFWRTPQLVHTLDLSQCRWFRVSSNVGVLQKCRELIAGLTSCSHLVSLSLTGLDQLFYALDEDTAVQRDFFNLPCFAKLAHLKLDYVSSLTCEIVQNFHISCPSLVHLDLSKTTCRPEENPETFFLMMTRFVLALCGQLETLHLSMTLPEPTEDCEAPNDIPDCHWPVLRNLHVDRSLEDAAMCALLEEVPQTLKEIRLVGAREVTDPFMVRRILQRLPNLQALTLEDYPARQKWPPPLAHSRQLKKLYLKNIRLVEVVPILNFLAQCVDLQELTLAQCDFVDTALVLHVSQALPQLRVLSLSSCSKLNDDAVQIIIRGGYLQHLQHLDVSWCMKLTDAAFLEAPAPPSDRRPPSSSTSSNRQSSRSTSFQNIPPLRYLNINFCSKLSERIVPSVIHKMRDLRQLHANQLRVAPPSEQVTEPAAGSSFRFLSSLCHLVSGCPHLQVLSLSQTNVSNWHVTTLWSELRELKELRLSSCDKLIDCLAENVTKATPTLRTVDLRMCMSLTEKTVATLKQKLPLTEVLYTEKE